MTEQGSQTIIFEQHYEYLQPSLLRVEFFFLFLGYWKY